MSLMACKNKTKQNQKTKKDDEESKRRKENGNNKYNITIKC